jgi:group I intron endonuclease
MRITDNIIFYKYLENKPGVYLIKNKLNNKVYVGSSYDVKKRIISHLSRLKNNKHHSKYLQASFNKYGKHVFSINILEYVKNTNILLKREQYWLNFFTSYNPSYGYNICNISKNTKGRMHSEKTKKLMSEKRKGQTVGVNNPFYGKKHTKENIAKILNNRKRSYKNELNPKWNNNVTLDIIFLKYKELKNLKDVCDVLKVSRDTLRRRLKKEGFIFKGLGIIIRRNE